MKYLLLLAAIALTACQSEDKDFSAKTVFVTDSSYSVSDIMGIANVDSICQSEANLSLYTSGKTFIAYYDDFADRANSFGLTKWKNSSNSLGKISGKFEVADDAVIDIDQYGNKIASVEVWANDTGLDCLGLTSTSSGDYTQYGRQEQEMILNYSTEACDVANFRFICVEN